MDTTTSLLMYHPAGCGYDNSEHWHVTCHDHDSQRANLSRIVHEEAHAINLEAKHLREYHAGEDWPDLNLSAVATLVLMAATIDDTYTESVVGVQWPEAAAVLGMWEALTGLPREEAIALAQRVQASVEPVTAAVVPF